MEQTLICKNIKLFMISEKYEVRMNPRSQPERLEKAVETLNLRN